ncbi:AN1-type zinc finger protein 2A isoform X2 [Cyanistes caeruleus]|uniref:AN1-type zinc finger protein 2A isoform X2 n=1 Tax=Cyanistes caeruleus TaxID=156563 RepID=UPI000CDA4962|nr:AN1-type zinc finger protein 2A isoform X2 [Cyanistes caeruleus]
MELPWLGEHCSERTCKQLDFLPLKCNACGEVFCKDHIRYDDHKCSSAYKKNVQVPVCPLCNTPIPVQKGEIPDIVVGAHIDKDCKYNPAQQKQKIFTNKCLKPGCKRKEMMKMVCEQCGGSFCIKHRHPLDHDCKGSSKPISKAGYAALMRASLPTFKSPGAIGVPSNGNPQHNSAFLCLSGADSRGSSHLDQTFKVNIFSLFKFLRN